MAGADHQNRTRRENFRKASRIEKEKVWPIVEALARRGAATIWILERSTGGATGRGCTAGQGPEYGRVGARRSRAAFTNVECTVNVDMDIEPEPEPEPLYSEKAKPSVR